MVELRLATQQEGVWLQDFGTEFELEFRVLRCAGVETPADITDQFIKENNLRSLKPNTIKEDQERQIFYEQQLFDLADKTGFRFYGRQNTIGHHLARLMSRFKDFRKVGMEPEFHALNIDDRLIPFQIPFTGERMQEVEELIRKYPKGPTSHPGNVSYAGELYLFRASDPKNIYAAQDLQSAIALKHKAADFELERERRGEIAPNVGRYLAGANYAARHLDLLRGVRVLEK